MALQLLELVVKYLVYNMLNKFLILIGLKQEGSDFLVEEQASEPINTVHPSEDSRFIGDPNSAEITVHSADDEVEIRALKSWREIENLGASIKEFNIVCMDLRDVYDKNERQRIIDFTSGMVHVMNSKLRIINPDGVYLIRKAEANLTVSERNRLEALGLYKV